MRKPIQYPVRKEYLTDAQKESLVEALLQFINMDGQRLENQMVNLIDLNHLAQGSEEARENYDTNDMDSMHRTADNVIQLITALHVTLHWNVRTSTTKVE